jgi:hypothetical protein
MGTILSIALWIGGVIVVLAIAWLISRGVYILLHKAFQGLKSYCGRFDIKLVSWWRVILAFLGAGILAMEELPIEALQDNPVIKLAIGWGIVGLAALSIIVKAKLHAPVVAVVQVLGIPLFVLYMVFGLICEFTGGTPESTNTYTTVVDFDLDDLPLSGGGSRMIYENGELKQVLGPKGDSYYGDDGRWYVRDDKHNDGMDHYVSRD